jgi:hypothetical protein
MGMVMVIATDMVTVMPTVTLQLMNIPARMMMLILTTTSTDTSTILLNLTLSNAPKAMRGCTISPSKRRSGQSGYPVCSRRSLDPSLT